MKLPEPNFVPNLTLVSSSGIRSNMIRSLKACPLILKVKFTVKTVHINLPGLKKYVYLGYNVWRHHMERHQTFLTNFPGSRERAATV